MVIASWTARPPDPRCPVVRNLAAIPPDAAKPNPVGTPGGVSGIRPTSATVLGFVSWKFRGGGSGLGGQSAEPFRLASLSVRLPYVPSPQILLNLESESMASAES
jgi:hypothetical protein